MPEILEIELYRRAAEVAVGRRITAVDAPDSWFCKRVNPEELIVAVTGRTIRAARRRGKLLVLDLSGGVRLGLRFGMTGRIIVDGRAAIEELQYWTTRDDPTWDRFALSFSGGRSLRINDPRRLGAVELEPDEDRLGPDALSLTVGELATALTGSTVALKARLMDQGRIAGIGNLLADEVLWRAALDPRRHAGSLDKREFARLHRVIRSTLPELLERGGSHLGDLMASRQRDGVCPSDGAPLQRRTIGGRTTFSCPVHQR